MAQVDDGRLLGDLLPGCINRQYPSSWWAAGFSDEVRAGEVVPVKLLERELILWRDTSGTLHCHGAICPHLGANIGYGGMVVGATVRCPLHGYRFDPAGALVHRNGEDQRAPARACLPKFVVDERYGTIVVWNGDGTPDHDLPDLLAGENLDDVSVFRVGFYLPFPAKLVLENLCDANHFAGLHGASEWGEAEVVGETPSRLHYSARFVNLRPFLSWESLRQHWAWGQLLQPVFSGEGLDVTTHGGGIHTVRFLEATGSGPGSGGRLPRYVDSVRLIISWTPIGAESHFNSYTFVMPKIRTPVLGAALRPLTRELIAMRTWSALVQDVGVMLHRQEPPDPCYGRLDRGLVRFRRFWDGRLPDRRPHALQDAGR